MSLQWQNLPVNQLPSMIPATELKNRLGTVIRSTIKNQREVIVSSRGVPKVVIVPFKEWEELAEVRRKQREKAERERDWATWKQLRQQVRARNQDLTEEQVDELSVRFSRDVIAEVLKKRKKKYG